MKFSIKLNLNRKQVFFEIMTVLIILSIFAFGWIYLEYIFYVVQKPFDFNIYLQSSEGAVAKEKTITSTVIVFSDFKKTRPVEIYVSNCPQQTTCVLSISSAEPTYTSELTVAPSDLTPEGTYPINIFATSGGIKKSTTYYLTIKPKECVCTEWVNLGCGGWCDSQMYVVRKCQPKGCDIESRCAYNYSCIKDFSIESIPTYRRIENQKASFVIKIASINDFSGLVYLSATGCPIGSMCYYSLSPVNIPENGSATSLLNINAALRTVVGNFTITTTVVSNNTIHSTNSTITIR